MKPKPLYRSLTFWCGILVMGFVCFAWWDSLRHHTLFQIYPFEAGNVEAGTIATWCPSKPIRGKQCDRTVRDQELGHAVFPPPLFLRGGGKVFDDEAKESGKDYWQWSFMDRARFSFRYSQPSWRMIFLPHWLLLLAVALPWSGLLLWRARRVRRGRMP